LLDVEEIFYDRIKYLAHNLDIIDFEGKFISNIVIEILDSDRKINTYEDIMDISNPLLCISNDIQYVSVNEDDIIISHEDVNIHTINSEDDYIKSEDKDDSDNENVYINSEDDYIKSEDKDDSDNENVYINSDSDNRGINKIPTLKNNYQ